MPVVAIANSTNEIDELISKAVANSKVDSINLSNRELKEFPAASPTSQPFEILVFKQQQSHYNTIGDWRTASQSS